MKLSYTTALLRYCNDLTDPDAANVPVAAFIVARSDDSYYAAAAGFDVRFVNTLLGGTEVLSETMLDDLPQLIKRHVNEVFSDQKEIPELAHVLFDLEAALRNTLNVTDISDLQEREIKRAEEESLGSFLSDLITHRLIEAVEPYGVELVTHHRRKPLRAITDRVIGSKQKEYSTKSYDLPAQTFWPVHSGSSARAIG